MSSNTYANSASYAEWVTLHKTPLISKLQRFQGEVESEPKKVSCYKEHKRL